MFPDDVMPRFSAPDERARMSWLADRPPIIIGEPADQLGATRDFYRVFESIEEGDYELLTCELIEPVIAEIHINPFGHPYGGVGPFVGLAEAFADGKDVG